MSDQPEEDFDVEEEAEKIVRESLEMGDAGPIKDINGKCVECGDIATWQSPITGDYYCNHHASERSAERHG